MAPVLGLIQSECDAPPVLNNNRQSSIYALKPSVSSNHNLFLNSVIRQATEYIFSAIFQY